MFKRYSVGEKSPLVSKIHILEPSSKGVQVPILIFTNVTLDIRQLRCIILFLSDQMMFIAVDDDRVQKTNYLITPIDSGIISILKRYNSIIVADKHLYDNEEAGILLPIILDEE